MEEAAEAGLPDLRRLKWYFDRLSDHRTFTLIGNGFRAGVVSFFVCLRLRKSDNKWGTDLRHVARIIYPLPLHGLLLERFLIYDHTGKKRVLEVNTDYF